MATPWGFLFLGACVMEKDRKRPFHWWIVGVQGSQNQGIKKTGRNMSDLMFCQRLLLALKMAAMPL
ncbi:MAG: hypothetical protein ACD_23C00241G0003 [uncultured bacterium]|nr:MAG: hypothetical protein ACD_23C00241G0003 [uncultured bacterium]